MFWQRVFRCLIGILAVVTFMTTNLSFAADSGQYKAVDGVAVYVGVIPAEIIRGHPKEHAETTMHGGIPFGARYHHVIVALFDSKTGARITSAEVWAQVSDLGHAGTRKKLERMKIADTLTYGNFFPVSAPGPYRIQIDIRRPERRDTLHAEFEYSHP